MKRQLLLTLASILGVASLNSCGKKSYDVEITVYNWEDYIYEGTDDEGEKIEDSTIEAFEKEYEAKTGKSIKVNYKTFSTCEEMYTKIDIGEIKVDLCCPSDYMIQKMQSKNMLESFGYDYDQGKYTEGLDNVNTYTSPYIKDLFKKNQFSDFAVPYFWGTMGFTYDTALISEEAVSSWDFLWNPGNDLKGKSLKKRVTIKDSVRDTYFTAVMHVYKNELNTLKTNYENETISASQYNDSLSEIFNRHDTNTLNAVKQALIALKENVTLEVDEGKNDMVLGSISANLAWSGDSVFSMDEAEDSDMTLAYSVPVEGSNVWFDGWCMPKGANVEAAKAFLDYLAKPEVAAKNMNTTGYTSPIAGDAIWELCNEWYSIDAYDGDYSEEECDLVDLSYFFEGTLSDGVEAKILVPTEERGRQFDAQYPSEEVIVRCAMMKDFGDEGNNALYDMWSEFKSN